MRYKFKQDRNNITLYVYVYTTTILLQGIWKQLSCCFKREIGEIQEFSHCRGHKFETCISHQK
jgi:hypothetical protein